MIAALLVLLACAGFMAQVSEDPSMWHCDGRGMEWRPNKCAGRAGEWRALDTPPPYSFRFGVDWNTLRGPVRVPPLTGGPAEALADGYRQEAP